MLPEINGKEVCQRVRNDPSMDMVKILCISGMVEHSKVDALKTAGANDFMQKPFAIDDLIGRACDQLEIERSVVGYRGERAVAATHADETDKGRFVRSPWLEPCDA